MKQRIAFVIESLQLGGAEKSLVTLLNHLDYGRYEVDLITFVEGGIFRPLVPNTVNQIVLPFPSFSFLERLHYFVKRKLNPRYNFAHLYWPITQHRFAKLAGTYDIAIAYGQGFPTYYTASRIAARHKFAWINTDYKRAGFDIRFDLPFYKQFDKVITVSNEAKNVFSQELTQLGHTLSLAVIPDIIDRDTIVQQSQLESDIPCRDGIDILTMARLAPEKGVLLALEACKLLVDRGLSVRWSILGGGGLRPRLDRLIATYGLEEHFVVLSPVVNPYPYIRHCAIYVQPSLYEGLGMAVLEAACLGKPIVATDFATVHEVIADGVNGYVTAFDAPSLADKVEALIMNAELRVHFAENMQSRSYGNKDLVMKSVRELIAECSYPAQKS